MNMQSLEKIDRRYDPEHDIPPGPAVTWADYTLMEAIDFLAGRVMELERIVQQLDPRLRGDTNAE